MPSSSSANALPSDNRDEQDLLPEHPAPSQRAQAVSPHAPEYKLFPTVYKPPPPVLRRRPHHPDADDLDSPELEGTHKSGVSIGRGRDKAVDAVNSTTSGDNTLQKLEHDGPGGAVKSYLQSPHSGLGDTPDSRWTGRDNFSRVRPELSGANLAPISPVVSRSDDLFAGGIALADAPPGKSGQFSLPPPSYLNEIGAARGQSTPQKVDARFPFNPELESHDPFNDTTASFNTHGALPYNTGHRRHNVSSNQAMAGSAMSALSTDAGSSHSRSGDGGSAPQTPTTSRSESHRHSSSVETGVGSSISSAPASSRNSQHNISSSASINPSISEASEALNGIGLRDTTVPGLFKATAIPACGSRPYSKISTDSRMSTYSPRRSESGSHGSLHTPTRLIGKVRSIFRSGSSSSTYDPSGRSSSSDSAVEQDPSDSYSSAFEARLMLQTLENSYHQHTLERRRELVEALQYLTNPSGSLKGDTLLSEFRRLRLETDSLFLLELEKEALEKQKVHELQLDAAAARHDRVRRDAESVRNDFERQLRMELERRREEEKRELDRIRQAKADQELAERRRHIELARAQAAEELRRAELEKQRLEEEARVKAAEDSKRIAEEKARAEAEAKDQARIKAEEDRKAENLLAASAAARGTSFTNVERENDNVDLMQDEYMRLHALLKGFRSWLTRQGKENPALKAKMGEMRREIKKTVGQLTAGKNANKEPVCSPP
jgi:hypothetical protein